MHQSNSPLVCPFARRHQLNHELDHIAANAKTPNDPPANADSDRLPGHPRILLHDTTRLLTTLTQDLHTPDLDVLAPRLWLLSTPSSANINALHAQHVRGRTIILTEDPRLHLVWAYDRIYIKPLPAYLLSHSFWTRILLPSATSSPSLLLPASRETLSRAALGLLRSYHHLIQHESDFRIAQRDDLHLLPADVTWRQFCDFSAAFDHCIADTDVSPRYEYGELRLTRLNFYIKLLLRRFEFHRVDGQYAMYFARFYTPLLFMFGVLAIVLNALQLELTAEGFAVSRWPAFWYLSRWFSVVSLLLAALVTLALVGLWSWLVVDEWFFAIRSIRRKRAAQRSFAQLAPHA